MRLNGLFVYEKQNQIFSESDDIQCIIVDGIYLPLKMKGPLAYLLIRRPITHELVDEKLLTIYITYTHGWDSYGDASQLSYDPNSMNESSCSVSHFLSRSFNRSITNIASNKRQLISIGDIIKRWGVGKETSK